MKTKLFSLLASLFALNAFIATSAVAQKITYDPPVPDPDAPLTITIDLDAVDNQTLAGLSPTPDIYLWTWTEGGGPASPTNGDWAQSNPAQKMTLVTGKKYKFTYAPTLKDFFASKAEVMWCLTLGCLAKAEDGSGSPEKKTEDFKTKIDCPANGPQLLSTHPVRLSALPDSVMVEMNDVITFKYNNNMDTSSVRTGVRQNLPPNSIYCFIKVYFEDGTAIQHSPYNGPTGIDVNPALLMKDMPGKEAHLSFITEQFFEQADCPNAALFAAKRTAGIHIRSIEMQPYKKRVSPGSGPFEQPFLPKYTFFLPKY